MGAEVPTARPVRRADPSGRRTPTPHGSRGLLTRAGIPRWTARTVLAAALPAVLVAVIGLALTRFNLWRLSGVFIMTEGYFEDLRQVTGTAGCIRADPGWTLASPSCDPWQRPYNYATLWARGFAALGLDADSTSLVGYALIVLFAVSVGVLGMLMLRGRPSWWKAGLFAVLAASPPSLFAMERGNIDIVVLVVVVAAVALTAAGLLALAAVLVAAATLMKVFPLGAFGLLLLRPRRAEAIALAVLVLVIGGVFVVPEVTTIARTTPQTTWQSFGVAVVPLAVLQVLGVTTGSGAARLGGVAVFLAVLGVLTVLRLRLPAARTAWHASVVRAIGEDRTAAAAVVGGGGALLVAHLVGTSWDYRLIFALPLIAGLLRVAGRSLPGATAIALVYGVQLFLTYPLSGPAPDVLGPEVWLGTIWLVTAPYLALLVGELLLRSLPMTAVRRGLVARRRTGAEAPARSTAADA